VRATVSAFRQHVPNPQQSDIAELVAVLQDYVTSRPQNETRGRRRATSGGRAAASKTAAAVASLNRSSSLPPLSPHRGSETTPQGSKTPVFCFGPHAFLCLPPSLFCLPLSLVFSLAHTPACTHTQTQTHTITVHNVRKDDWHRLALERDARDVRANMCVCLSVSLFLFIDIDR
jgi:hypothetical protein